ncbi:MAG TPA: hypothetical protein V6D08_03100 [Candidatus Obscuribacterales bacterium]
MNGARKPHILAAALLFASLFGAGTACALKSSRPRAADEPVAGNPEVSKASAVDLKLKPKGHPPALPDPLAVPSYSSLTEPEEPAPDPDDNCRQFWRRMGVRSQLPPLLKDCGDVTLYRKGDVQLIFSFPSFIIRFP